MRDGHLGTREHLDLEFHHWFLFSLSCNLLTSAVMFEILIYAKHYSKLLIRNKQNKVTLECQIKLFSTDSHHVSAAFYLPIVKEGLLLLN